jgi:hypothetical protein
MIGCGLLSTQLIQKPSHCEEEAKSIEQNVDFEIGPLDNFDELTSDNLKQVMESEKSKFIFYFDPEKLSKQYNSQGKTLVRWGYTSMVSADGSTYVITTILVKLVNSIDQPL